MGHTRGPYVDCYLKFSIGKNPIELLMLMFQLDEKIQTLKRVAKTFGKQDQIKYSEKHFSLTKMLSYLHGPCPGMA
jgi:hypothetical protein